MTVGKFLKLKVCDLEWLISLSSFADDSSSFLIRSMEHPKGASIYLEGLQDPDEKSTSISAVIFYKEDKEHKIRVLKEETDGFLCVYDAEFYIHSFRNPPIKGIYKDDCTLRDNGSKTTSHMWKIESVIRYTVKKKKKSKPLSSVPVSPGSGCPWTSLVPRKLHCPPEKNADRYWQRNLGGHDEKIGWRESSEIAFV